MPPGSTFDINNLSPNNYQIGNQNIGLSQNQNGGLQTPFTQPSTQPANQVNFGQTYNPPQVQGAATQAFQQPQSQPSSPPPNTASNLNSNQQQNVAQARAQGQYQGWPDWQVAADLAQKGNQPQPPDTSIFDKMIQPVINNFESLIGTQQQTTANNISALGTQRNTELDTEKSQFAGQEQGLNTQATAQQNSANNAIEEAKRMYAEMSQGNLARYGATTGTGAFLNEQLGQSTGRNIALLHQGLTQSLQDINDKIAQVKQTGELAIRGTNERFDQAIQTERDNLQKFIGQIKGNEAMLQSNKAQLAAQAVQHYQDTVNNIEAQRKQQQQQWATAVLDAQTKLQIYGQRGTQMLTDIRNNAPNYLNIVQQGQPNNITPVTPTTPQNTGSLLGLAQPQQNAFQSATGMNQKLNALA